MPHGGSLICSLKATTACGGTAKAARTLPGPLFFIDNLLVRIHFIIVMIWWTGLAPWGFEFPFPGSLTSTFLGHIPLVPYPHTLTGDKCMRGHCQGSTDATAGTVAYFTRLYPKPETRNPEL